MIGDEASTGSDRQLNQATVAKIADEDGVQPDGQRFGPNQAGVPSATALHRATRYDCCGS